MGFFSIAAFLYLAEPKMDRLVCFRFGYSVLYSVARAGGYTLGQSSQIKDDGCQASAADSRTGSAKG